MGQLNIKEEKEREIIMKKIIIAVIMLLTIFSSVSFASNYTVNTYKNKNSVEGVFLRKIFKDIRNTPTAVYKTGIYYDTDIVCALKAVRLCLSSSYCKDDITNKEAMELAEYLVEEMKKENKSKKWYQKIICDR